MSSFLSKILDRLVRLGPFSCLVLAVKRLAALAVRAVTLALRLVMALLNATVFRWCLRAAKIIDYPFRALIKRAYMRSVPIRDDRVVLITFQGTFTCNPRMIAEELLSAPEDYDLVWVVKDDAPVGDYPLGLRFVRYDTLPFYRELAGARVIVENTNILERLQVRKKPGQTVIQTWHGSLGIKRLDGDVVRGLRWDILARRARETVDCMLCDSDFDVDVFRGAYWKDAPEYLMTGHPRNDIFFWPEDRKRAVVDKVYRTLGIAPEKKLFLYAPTHSDTLDASFTALPYEKLARALHDRFGGEWQIVVRVHNRLKKQSRAWFRTLPDCVSDATMYDDMQDILVAAEAGLTDYSSWIFDFMLTYKPAFVITLHYDVFAANRGFYYPLESTPFPIAPDVKTLLHNIRAFDDAAYRPAVAAFLASKGCMEDGQASARTAEKIRALTHPAP